MYIDLNDPNSVVPAPLPAYRDCPKLRAMASRRLQRWLATRDPKHWAAFQRAARTIARKK